MRGSARIVSGWLLAAALEGCGAASAQRAYPMSPPMVAGATAAQETAASTGSAVEEGPSVSADSDAPAPAAPAREQPGGDEISMAPRSRAPARAAPPPPPAQPAGPATNNQAQPQQAATRPAQPAAPAPAPMLIYTADIDMQVERSQVGATLDRVIEAATGMGGYLLRRTDTSVQVRVPSARFREGMRQFEGFGEVLHRSVAAQDVSEEYHDLEVRLQNLRAVRRRLEEFLQRAGSMADALQVERELERVTREIDTIEGRLRFLGTRVAFSLVTVNVRPRPEASVAAGPAMPPRRVLNLPVEWFHRLGLERLLHTAE